MRVGAELRVRGRDLRYERSVSGRALLSALHRRVSDEGRSPRVVLRRVPERRFLLADLRPGRARLSRGLRVQDCPRLPGGEPERLEAGLLSEDRDEVTESFIGIQPGRRPDRLY